MSLYLFHIETLLEILQGEELKSFTATAKVQFAAAKKWNYNKQLIVIEGILFHSKKPQRNPQNRKRDIGASRFANSNTSNVPTPALTNGQNSPQSSIATNTSLSIVDTPSEADAVPNKIVNENEGPITADAAIERS